MDLCEQKWAALEIKLCDVICRTVFILSEALDEHLKALWFSPFQADDIESDLDTVSPFL